MSVCPSVRLSVCPSVRLSVRMNAEISETMRRNRVQSIFCTLFPDPCIPLSRLSVRLVIDLTLVAVLFPVVCIEPLMQFLLQRSFIGCPWLIDVYAVRHRPPMGSRGMPMVFKGGTKLNFCIWVNPDQTFGLHIFSIVIRLDWPRTDRIWVLRVAERLSI